jgi:hypothetical protein
MRKGHSLLVLVGIGLFVAFALLIYSAEDDMENRRPSFSAEEERIVGIALKAVEEFSIPDRWDVEVTRAKSGEYIVTWPVRYAEPSLGPDYYARVFVDPKRGVVTSKWIGN